MTRIGGSFRNSCEGVMGFLFGHKLEPRYNEKDTTSDKVVEEAKKAVDTLFNEDYYANSYDAARVLEEFRGMNSVETTYIHDVCVRCGKVIKR